MRVVYRYDPSLLAFLPAVLLFGGVESFHSLLVFFPVSVERRTIFLARSIRRYRGWDLDYLRFFRVSRVNYRAWPSSPFISIP